MSENDTVEVDRELLAKALIELRGWASSVRRHGNRRKAREIEDLVDSLSDVLHSDINSDTKD